MRKHQIIMILAIIMPIMTGMAGDVSIENKPMNHLRNQKSAYLRQHVYQPVDWYPWGKEAFAKAKAENKPIFLSIGYSTCHWCHVMAQKCFENPKVAEALNKTFVCIKVDREERPDIDAVYMRVCQILTGSGGWPLNIIMTPDMEPISAATYIPPETLINISDRIGYLWKNNRKQLFADAKAITEHLKKANHGEIRDDAFVSGIENAAVVKLQGLYDSENGGFGKAPKFPSPQRLMFLHRYWYATSDADALKLSEKTLIAMRLGGIYDHLDSGFHRYTIDEKWRVPHFEKMLYDQAMLVMAYTEFFQISGNPFFGDTAKDVISYVMRTLSSPDGGFYSAEDADPEYYLFRYSRLRAILSQEELELAGKIYNFNPEGNFVPESGQNLEKYNIIYLKKPVFSLAETLNTSPVLLRNFDRKIRAVLSGERQQKNHPFKDTKIIAGWNGLMIAALAKASSAFDSDQYIGVAEKAARLISTKLIKPDGGMYHCLIDGQPSGDGVLDDYAYYIWGLLELYKNTYNPSWLELAEKLVHYVSNHFTDEQRGGFLDTADNAEKLLIRPRSVYDSAIPSGNTVMMLNLLRLGALTENVEFISTAEKIGTAMATETNRSPENVSLVICSLMFAKYPPWQVIVVGRRGDEDTEKMLKMLRKPFAPFTCVRYLEAGKNGFSADGNHQMKNAVCTVYICRNRACLPPIHDPAEVARELKIKQP